MAEYKLSDLPKRLQSKIMPEPISGCWLWTRCLVYGYGSVYWDGKLRKAHRVVYEILKEPIPYGLHIDHLCRVRSCVNPNHLEPVTNRENIQRGNSGLFNRRKTHCSRGHAFTEDNTIVVKGRERERFCKTCIRERQRELRARKKEERRCRLKRSL